MRNVAKIVRHFSQNCAQLKSRSSFSNSQSSLKIDRREKKTAAPRRKKSYRSNREKEREQESILLARVRAVNFYFCSSIRPFVKRIQRVGTYVWFAWLKSSSLFLTVPRIALVQYYLYLHTVMQCTCYETNR